ncbi:MAG: acyl-CoA synthetase [Actinomycetota bacterium]
MTGERNWGRAPVPADRAAHYRGQGWWTDATLGQTVAAGLAAAPDAAFRVHSKVRPWVGTIGDVDAAARTLAASLQARGVGPGSVVVSQVPNWVEAGITFWAAAYLGAVMIPIVHFYGPKEVGYILRTVAPDVVVTADRFGATDFLANYTELLTDYPDTPWLVAGATPRDQLPPGAVPFDDMLGGGPLAEPLAVDPDAATLVAFTSGTTRDPKGVVHSHRTLGFETRQLVNMLPDIGPPLITGAPVGHFIGMLNAFLCPLLRSRPVNMVDVWDPAEVLRIMREFGVGMGGGATFFLTSLLDHPDFGDDVVPLMPFAGLGGSTVPIAVTERAEALGIRPYRSYGSTEHPSITGCDLDDPVDKRLTTDGRPLFGCEIRLDEEGEISSRGPDRCIGYTDAALTAEMFDADGWYRTGDVGVLDVDGYLTITDRVSDVIIRGGENISAQEVEELLLGHVAIAEVAVVSAPDERLGERAAAVVRTHAGAAVTLDDLRAHLAERGLAKQKWPESLYEVADFPRTPSGKVQKFRLRQQLRDGEL